MGRQRQRCSLNEDLKGSARAGDANVMRTGVELLNSHDVSISGNYCDQTPPRMLTPKFDHLNHNHHLIKVNSTFGDQAT